MGYIRHNPPLQKTQWYNLTDCWKISGFIHFLKMHKSEHNSLTGVQTCLLRSFSSLRHEQLLICYSELSFLKISCSAKKISLSCYLPMTGGRMNVFIPFPTILALYEKKTPPSKIWTLIPFPTSIINTSKGPLLKYIPVCLASLLLQSVWNLSFMTFIHKAKPEGWYGWLVGFYVI